MPLNPFLYKAAAGTLHQQADINMRPQPTPRVVPKKTKTNTAVHNGLRYTPTLSLSLSPAAPRLQGCGYGWQLQHLDVAGHHKPLLKGLGRHLVQSNIGRRGRLDIRVPQLP